LEAYLRELYGDAAIDGERLEKLKVERSGDRPAVEVIVGVMGGVVRVTPSDCGPGADREVVMDVVKRQAIQRDVAQKQAYKTIIVESAGDLSAGAQAAMRRTMETYAQACRFVLVCRSVSRVCAPLRSRCACVRVPAPTPEEISSALVRVAEEETNTRGVLTSERASTIASVAVAIAARSQRNMRRAIDTLETWLREGRCAPSPLEAVDPQLAEAARVLMLPMPTVQRKVHVAEVLLDMLLDGIPACYVLKGVVEGISASDRLPEPLVAECVGAAAACDRSITVDRMRPPVALDIFILDVLERVVAAGDATGGASAAPSLRRAGAV
jgi:replication factor C subunit 3/5